MIKYMEEIPGETSDDMEFLGSIVPPTPISRHRYSDTEFISEIEICLTHSNLIDTTWIRIPIKYYPYCGKELSR